MSKIVADNLDPRGSGVSIVGVTTATSNGLNVTGVVTATSFDGGDVNTGAGNSVTVDNTLITSTSIGVNTSRPQNHDDGGVGGANVVIGATGVGRGTLQFVSQQTGGADEPLGIVNFVDLDTTNTSDRGARILGLRGADANSAYLRFETANSGSPVERLRITSAGGFTFNNGTLIENVNITAGKVSDNQDINLDNGMVHYFTTTETTTSTPNIVSGVGINTALSTGDTIAVTMINTAAAAGYSPTLTIDGAGAGITTHWSGGEAPSEGSSSGSDVYAYTIVKTGDAAYRVFASFTNFA